jgi:hypothetical protein
VNKNLFLFRNRRFNPKFVDSSYTNRNILLRYGPYNVALALSNCLQLDIPHFSSEISRPLPIQPQIRAVENNSKQALTSSPDTSLLTATSRVQKPSGDRDIPVAQVDRIYPLRKRSRTIDTVLLATDKRTASDLAQSNRRGGPPTPPDLENRPKLLLVEDNAVNLRVGGNHLCYVHGDFIGHFYLLYTWNLWRCISSCYTHNVLSSLSSHTDLEQVLVAFLDRMGHAVSTAENGLIALESFKSSNPPFDIVITGKPYPLRF